MWSNGDLCAHREHSGPLAVAQSVPVMRMLVRFSGCAQVLRGSILMNAHERAFLLRGDIDECG
jgi:hypothetical protein